MFLCYLLKYLNYFSNILDNILFIINAGILHSSVISLNCHPRRHMVLTRCR